MHKKEVNAGAKAVAIACVVSAIPTVSLIVHAPINLYQFNSCNWAWLLTAGLD
jgi:hypothetical protein